MCKSYNPIIQKWVSFWNPLLKKINQTVSIAISDGNNNEMSKESGDKRKSFNTEKHCQLHKYIEKHDMARNSRHHRFLWLWSIKERPCVQMSHHHFWKVCQKVWANIPLPILWRSFLQWKLRCNAIIQVCDHYIEHNQ